MRELIFKGTTLLDIKYMEIKYFKYHYPRVINLDITFSRVFYEIYKAHKIYTHIFERIVTTDCDSGSIFMPFVIVMWYTPLPILILMFILI